MDDDKTQRLIEEIHQKPIIWDISLQAYKNKRKRGEVWSKIADNLKITKPTAQGRWKTLLKAFRLEYSRVQELKSGDGLEDCYESSWKFYPSLSFLIGRTEPNTSIGNLDFLDNHKPSVKSIKSEVPANSVIMDKQSVAEQLLKMENEKRALLNKNTQISDKAEIDKSNTFYFESLLPTMRKIKEEDLLPCRNEIDQVVQRYVYKSTRRHSLSEPNRVNHTPYQNLEKLPGSRRVNYAYESDDDVQIISYNKPSSSSSRYQSREIKVEKKYKPSQLERAVEEQRTTNCEYPMQQFGQYSKNNYSNQLIPPVYRYQQPYESLYPALHNNYWPNDNQANVRQQIETVTSDQYSHLRPTSSSNMSYVPSINHAQVANVIDADKENQGNCLFPLSNARSMPITSNNTTNEDPGSEV